MTDIINKKIESLGIALPDLIKPAANYSSFTKTGNLIFISGQIPIVNGQLKYIGKVGIDITMHDAKKAAEICAINVISQLRNACQGDLDKVKKCIKIGVFVNSDSNFIDHPSVADGASDLIVEIFGEYGKHSRFAVGASSLPRGVCVEIEAIFEVE